MCLSKRRISSYGSNMLVCPKWKDFFATTVVAHLAHCGAAPLTFEHAFVCPGVPNGRDKNLYLFLCLEAGMNPELVGAGHAARLESVNRGMELRAAGQTGCYVCEALKMAGLVIDDHDPFEPQSPQLNKADETGQSSQEEEGEEGKTLGEGQDPDEDEEEDAADDDDDDDAGNEEDNDEDTDEELDYNYDYEDESDNDINMELVNDNGLNIDGNDLEMLDIAPAAAPTDGINTGARTIIQFGHAYAEVGFHDPNDFDDTDVAVHMTWLTRSETEYSDDF